jgi:hypothetical protein
MNSLLGFEKGCRFLISEPEQLTVQGSDQLNGKSLRLIGSFDHFPQRCRFVCSADKKGDVG